MPLAEAASRPPILMIESEAEALADLALSVQGRHPAVSELLLHEIGRARTRPASSMPAGVVTMLSTVEFIDERNDSRHVVQLVYPKDADISAGRISILTPVGAGLIGLREGQSIRWPNRDGKVRNLRIEKVTQASG